MSAFTGSELVPRNLAALVRGGAATQEVVARARRSRSRALGCAAVRDAAACSGARDALAREVTIRSRQYQDRFRLR